MQFLVFTPGLLNQKLGDLQSGESEETDWKGEGKKEKAGNALISTSRDSKPRLSLRNTALDNFLF